MKLISTDEAAEILGLSGRRIRQLIDAGTLPAQKIGGGYVIEESALKTVQIHGKPGRPPRAKAEALSTTNGATKRTATKPTTKRRV